MRSTIHLCVCAALTALGVEASAATVFRCTDENGKITFTQQGCRTTEIQSTQRAHNPPPGGDRPTLMSSQDGTSTPHTATALTVVGEREDGCGNRVTGQARREAMIRQQIRSGMTRADVESSLGRPDQVSSTNGTTRYHYVDMRGHKRQVTFDESNCVK